VTEIIAVIFIEGERFSGEEKHIGDVGQRIGWLGEVYTVPGQRLGGECDANPFGFDAG